MRSCVSAELHAELFRHLGDHTDVPAGDIGVGAREVGYLFGQYERITNRYDAGTFTGKDIGWGGFWCGVRRPATAPSSSSSTCSPPGQSMDGMKVVISGSGNVAIYAAEKAEQLGAGVIALSDSSGYVFDDAGIDIAAAEPQGTPPGTDIRLPEARPSAHFVAGRNVWGEVPCRLGRSRLRRRTSSTETRRPNWSRTDASATLEVQKCQARRTP